MCGYYVPIIYRFLQNKSEETYIEMWEGVRQLCFDFFKLPPNIRNLLSDFEPAAHSAILHFHPDCRILGCNFHLGQSWYRKICSEKVLPEEYAEEDSEVGSWLKLLFGLSYLPPDEVSDVFLDIMSVAPDGDVHVALIFMSLKIPSFRLMCG